MKNEKSKSKLKTFLVDLVTGGMAAGISKTMVAPIETIKMRLQSMDEMVKQKIKNPQLQKARKKSRQRKKRFMLLLTPQERKPRLSSATGLKIPRASKSWLTFQI